MNDFDWSDLAFSSKKSVNGLNAVFIAAPREISTGRLTQFVKEYLPKNNIVLGVSKEGYIEGLEGQPQFKTLKEEPAQQIADKVKRYASKNKVYILRYFQRETAYILEKLKFSKVLLVNGSWHHAFHNLPAYYVLINTNTLYKHVSPFIDEQEAKAYEKSITKEVLKNFSDPKTKTYSMKQMMDIAQGSAKLSFDYNFQTGAALGRKVGKGYEFLLNSFNKVVPYQTYAMHFGASREINFSPPHDLNHYDTVHAEVEILIKAQKENIDIKNTALFINLMPCPACARMFIETDIAEFVYSSDHSDGYAIKLLERAGKKVRRIVI